MGFYASHTAISYKHLHALVSESSAYKKELTHTGFVPMDYGFPVQSNEPNSIFTPKAATHGFLLA